MVSEATSVHVDSQDNALGDDGARIVVGHNVLWANHHIVPSLDDFAFR